MTYYSNSDAIKQHCRLITTDGTLSAVSPAQMLVYQREADKQINAQLRQLYWIPLQPVIVDGTTNPVTTEMPDPIPEIASRLVAAMMVMDVYADEQPNYSDAANKTREYALELLAKITRREVILEGQRRKPRDPNSDPYTEPVAEPAAAGGSVAQ